MPTNLILGPLLRYAGETGATVWVETDAACEVDVLVCPSRTFCVEGHHYALVHVTGLEPESSTKSSSMGRRSGRKTTRTSREE